jgi:hypothetical protein
MKSNANSYRKIIAVIGMALTIGGITRSVGPIVTRSRIWSC